MTTQHTSEALPQIFLYEGLTDINVTDNGSQCVSKSFNNFCVKLNISHLTLPIFHPCFWQFKWGSATFKLLSVLLKKRGKFLCIKSKFASSKLEKTGKHVLKFFIVANQKI